MAKKQEMTIEQRMEEALVLYEKTPYKLPPDWCWIRLGTVCKLCNGEKSDKEELFYLDVKTLRTQNYERTKKNGVIVDEGQRVILVDGENSGEVFDIRKRGYMGSTFRILDIDKALNQIYVRYFILSHQDELRNNKIGSAIPHLNKKLFFNLLFPLAPLEEQRRIVEVIENQFAKLDEASDLIQKSLDSFADRKVAILNKAFSGELTKKWREVNNIHFEWKNSKLAEIGEVITGRTPNTKKSEYFNGNFPFVKPADLNQGRHIIEATETLSEKGKQVSRVIRAGSTCVCCIGTIGKCGFLQVEATTNQQINSISPFDFMVDLYVYYYCCSDDFKQRLIDKSSATTLSIISKKKMADLEIAVPSKPEQEEIVRILDSIFKKEDKSKELIDMLDKIDEMKKSILTRAFRGELSTSSPADEPAIELLKTILGNQVSVIDKTKNIKRKTNTGFQFRHQFNKRQLKICELLIQSNGLSIDKIAQGVGKDVIYLFDDLRELKDKRMIKLSDDRYEINADNTIKNQ